MGSSFDELAGGKKYKKSQEVTSELVIWEQDEEREVEKRSLREKENKREKEQQQQRKKVISKLLMRFMQRNTKVQQPKITV